MAIYDELYDWQKELIDKFYSRKTFGIFLDCGLGKTPISLAFAEKFMADKIIIVTINPKTAEPTSIKGSWREWLTHLSTGPFEVISKTSAESEIKFEEKQALLINYEYLYDRTKDDPDISPRKNGAVKLRPLVEKFIKSCKGSNVCIILDESHKIKDPQSVQALALQNIKRHIMRYANNYRAYLLTGTPFTSGFLDIWNQLKFLDCPITKQQFKDNFCVMGHLKGLLGWQQPVVGYKNLPELYKLIHLYGVTYKASDVIKLPEQIYNFHEYPESLPFRAFTKELITGPEIDEFNKYLSKNMLAPVDKSSFTKMIGSTKYINRWHRCIAYPDDSWFADTPAMFWLRSRELSIGFQGNADSYEWFDRSRLAAIKKFLSDNPDNYVLFYNFVPEFLELFDICMELGYNVDVFNGSIKSLDNYDEYLHSTVEERVINNKNIILSNFASGSTGMNWQAYRQCIIASLPLYKDWEQGLKRIHRIGSTEPVTYHVFTSDNYLDKSMYHALEEGVDYSVDMFNIALNSNK